MEQNNFKVDAVTYIAICKAVFDSITSAFARGQHGLEADESIETEYKRCNDKIFKILGGEIKQ